MINCNKIKIACWTTNKVRKRKSHHVGIFRPRLRKNGTVTYEPIEKRKHQTFTRSWRAKDKAMDLCYEYHLNTDDIVDADRSLTGQPCDDVHPLQLAAMQMEVENEQAVV
jgi:hypothetical protein